MYNKQMQSSLLESEQGIDGLQRRCTPPPHRSMQAPMENACASDGGVLFSEGEGLGHLWLLSTVATAIATQLGAQSCPIL